MAVSLQVIGENNTINVFQLPPPSELGPQVNEEEERATAVTFLATLRASAEEEERRRNITTEESRAVRLRPETEGEEQEAGVTIGESFRQWGDAVQTVANAISEDEEVNEFIDAAAAGDWSTAFAKFVDVAKQVLECDDDGLATGINLGRVFVLFVLGAKICLKYLKRVGPRQVMVFMKQFTTFLLRFLASVGFFAFLRRLGGYLGILEMNRVTMAGVFGVMAIAAAVLGGLLLYKLFK